MPSTGYGGYRDPLRNSRNAFRQTHIPTAFAFVHLENQAGIGWRMVHRRINQEKIAPHLADWNRKSIDQQAHNDLGGVPALTRQTGYGRGFHSKCHGLRCTAATPTWGAPRLRYSRYHLCGRRQVRWRQNSNKSSSGDGTVSTRTFRVPVCKKQMSPRYWTSTFLN